MDIIIAFILLVIAVACMLKTPPIFTFRIEHVYPPVTILQDKELNPEKDLENQKTQQNLDSFIQSLHDVMGVNLDDSNDRSA